MDLKSETLNDLYMKSCKPKCKSYQKILDNVTLIDNFFEDFDAARNFFINREKWKCISYQDHSKPGYETIFPNWVGKSLMENYVADNKINYENNEYLTECNFFYYSNNIWSLSNSNYFPHIDGTPNSSVIKYICLININLVPVSTKFYTFEGNDYCDSNIKPKWDNYYKKITKELQQYYNKEIITKDEVKLFLDNKQKLDVKCIKYAKYEPNQAIVYPANLFHSANVTEEFTEENPRSLIRVSFNGNFIENKNMKFMNYI